MYLHLCYVIDRFVHQILKAVPDDDFISLNRGRRKDVLMSLNVLLEAFPQGKVLSGLGLLVQGEQILLLLDLLPELLGGRCSNPLNDLFSFSCAEVDTSRDGAILELLCFHFISSIINFLPISYSSSVRSSLFRSSANWNSSSISFLSFVAPCFAFSSRSFFSSAGTMIG